MPNCPAKSADFPKITGQTVWSGIPKINVNPTQASDQMGRLANKLIKQDLNPEMELHLRRFKLKVATLI